MNWYFFLEPPLPVMRRPRGRQGTTAHHTHPQTKEDQRRIRDRFFKLYGSPRSGKLLQLTVKVFPVDHRSVPDLNNVIGCVQDALNKVAYEDDSQIRRITDCDLFLFGSPRPGIEVTITEL